MKHRLASWLALLYPIVAGGIQLQSAFSAQTGAARHGAAANQTAKSSEVWLNSPSGLAAVLVVSPELVGLSEAASKAKTVATTRNFNIGWEEVMLSGVLSSVLMILSILATLLALYYLDSVLGTAVKEVLETVDRSLMGVDLEFGSVRFHPCRGWIHIQDLRVTNPIAGHHGQQYEREHLMKAKTLYIDLDMMALLTSFGRTISVEVVELDGIEVFVEKTVTTSNVQDVLNTIQGKKLVEADEATTKPADGDVSPTSASSPAEKEKQQKLAKAKPKQAEKKGKFELHKVALHNIHVRLEIEHWNGLGADLDVADIVYEDFAKEVGASWVDDAFVIILQTLLKSVARTVFHNAAVCCASPCQNLGQKKRKSKSPAKKMVTQQKGLCDRCSCYPQGGGGAQGSRQSGAGSSNDGCPTCCVGVRKAATGVCGGQ